MSFNAIAAAARTIPIYKIMVIVNGMRLRLRRDLVQEFVESTASTFSTQAKAKFFQFPTLLKNIVVLEIIEWNDRLFTIVGVETAEIPLPLVFDDRLLSFYEEVEE